MVLVLTIALAIVVLLLLIMVFMICISNLEINMKNVYINNINKSKNNERVLIKLSFKIGKWNWLKIKLDKNKLANLYANMKIKEYQNSLKYEHIKKNAENIFKKAICSKNFRKLVTSTNIELERFNANICVGTENYIFTSYIVAAISIIISNILPHVVSKEETKKGNITKIIHYRIVPIYKEKNEYYVHLTLILKTKIWHLLKIAIELIKIAVSTKNRTNKESLFLQKKKGIKVKPV